MHSTFAQCIFFASFDNIAGPRLEFQAPSGYISADSFDSISEYMITQPDLCGKVVTIEHHSLGESSPAGGVATPSISDRPAKIMGCPIGLMHERYPRNQLLCCIAFVLDISVDPRPFDVVLRKLARYFLSMELERGFLSLACEKAKLAELLPSILHGLNTRGECFVRAGAGDTIALKLFPVLPQPTEIADHNVPLPTRDLDMLTGNGEDSGLDFAMRVVLPHVDGVQCIQAIAERANMDVSIVKQCCRHLLYFGFIYLVDIFQFSNIYASQPRVQLLLSNRSLRESALRYIAASPVPCVTSAARSTLEAVPAFDLVFRIYAAFGAGTQICDISMRAGTAELGIDDRRLVIFGLLHGILSRVYKYPVPLPVNSVHPTALVVQHSRGLSESESSISEPESALNLISSKLRSFDSSAPAFPPASATSSSGLLSDSVLMLLDGSRHLEQLCCMLHCSQAALEAAIDSKGGFVYILK
jgi:hypothetical protein